VVHGVDEGGLEEPAQHHGDALGSRHHADFEHVAGEEVDEHHHRGSVAERAEEGVY